MKIFLLPGDGIGPEVIRQAEKVLKTISIYKNIDIEIESGLIGGAAIDRAGNSLPEETLMKAKNSDAVLLAAVGGPKWDSTDPKKPRPEDGLLQLRKSLNLYVNLRPIKVYEALLDISPLKKEFLRGTDFIFIRELTSGIYFGKKERTDEGALDTCYYSNAEVERALSLAFKTAMQRKRKLTLIDKANVLETSRLWREMFFKVSEEFLEVEKEVLLVDNAAMQLILRPSSFDVIVTENMFGDILSDEASLICGSIGLLASASLGDEHPFLYEPIHGSAPNIAGKNIANPLAMILSTSMMMRYSFRQFELADLIEEAVGLVISEGYRTADIARSDERKQIVGTNEMGDLVIMKLEELLKLNKLNRFSERTGGSNANPGS